MTNRWKIGLLAAGLLIAGIAAGLTRLYPRIDRSRSYRVGVDHAPPYNLVNPGQPVTGLAVEILREAARRQRVSLTFVQLDIPVDEAFRKGLVDLWPAATDTPARRRWLHVTSPYLANELVIVSTTKHPIHTAQELENKAVSLLNSRILQEVAGRAVPNARAIEVRDRFASLSALCQGKVDASIIEQRFFEQALLERPADCRNTQFHALNASGARRMLAILSTHQAAPVADALRNSISDMIGDGAFFQILDSWSAFTGTDARNAQHLLVSRRLAQFHIGIFIAILLFVAALGYQNRRLRRAHELYRTAGRAKSEFLASVSHEIRTPLNGILGMAQVLIGSQLSGEQKENATVIRQSAESLLRIINDILDVSKAEAGKLRIDSVPFDPVRLVRQIWSLTQGQARAKALRGHLDLSPSLPGRLMGDPDRLGQILVNLISNAIKFTDDGEMGLSVDVENQTSASATLRFRVKDTGIGIKADKLPKLFEKFYQADSSTTRRYGGTGLGLAISRELVQMMGGHIAVQSEEGVGSEFTVSIPFTVASTQPGPEASPVSGDDAQSPSSLKVLLVEDNLVNQRVGLRLLERLGCSVDLAATGWEAVQLAGEGTYQLILMDCQMPELDGYEATALIRQREGTGRHTSIVAMTAAAMDGDRDRCLAAGMDDYLSKPVQLTELAALLERLQLRKPVSTGSPASV